MVDKRITLPVSQELMKEITEAARLANNSNHYLKQELSGLPPEALKLAMNIGSFLTHMSVNNIELVSYAPGTIPRELSQFEIDHLRVAFVKHFFLGSRNVNAQETEGTMPMSIGYVNQDQQSKLL